MSPTWQKTTNPATLRDQGQLTLAECSATDVQTTPDKTLNLLAQRRNAYKGARPHAPPMQPGILSTSVVQRAKGGHDRDGRQLPDRWKLIDQAIGVPLQTL